MSIAPTAITPFRIEVPDEQLGELRRRISATRWPSKELVADRSQGVQLATVRALAEYWVNDYDWRRCEARLNALPQFKTEIDGVDVHFIHVKSRHEKALPLIMTHGWPGSVIEMLDTVGPLTDPTEHGGQPEDAFDLVLPSVPGYGFSARAGRGRLGPVPDRTGVGRADAPSRLYQLCRPGRRRGRRRHRRDEPPGTRGPDRRPHEPARACAERPRGPAGGHRAGKGGARRDQDVRDERQRLLRGAVHQAPDHRLRAAGLPRRTRGVDGGPRHGRLLQDRAAPSPTTSRRATSPATTSSTTSRPTG